MANHAHSTRTPLLPLADHRLPLLGAGLSRHLGPVTLAIRAARHRANPTSALLAAQHQEERRALRELRERIASRIEADLAILDALDGDPDLEADYTTVEHAPGGGLMSLRRSTDEEPGDNGLGDIEGQHEQCGHGAFHDTVFA